MTKTVNRALSMLLSVLMLVSMVSVFCFPTYASTENSTVTSITDEIDMTSSAVIDEANLDYEALRKDENAEDNFRTFIINSAWSSSLSEGSQLSYYFRGQTYTENYDADRHFNSFTKAYNAYVKELNGSNFLTYVPVFIFAPGTYSDVIITHGNAIILGPNAGINPSDTSVTWNYTNMTGGWPANSAWNTANTATFTGSFKCGTRDKDEKMNGPYQKYLESAKSANGNKAELEYVIDGVSFASGVTMQGSYYDNGSDGGTAGTIVDKHLQNSVVNNPGNEFSKTWDVSHSDVSQYITNVRFETVSAKNLFSKYVANAFYTGCYFNNVTGALLSDDGSGDRGAFSIGGVYREGRIPSKKQDIVFKNNVIRNVTSKGAVRFGPHASSMPMNFIFDSNIVCNISNPLIVLESAVSASSSLVTAIIDNNQFYNNSETTSVGTIDLSGAGNRYFDISFKNNDVIGGFTSMSAEDFNESTVSKMNLDLRDNYWADTYGSAGKAHYLTGSRNFSVVEGFLNDYDFTTAPYFINSEKTVRNTELNLAGIEGFDYYTIGSGDIKTLVLNSKDKEDVVVTKDNFKIGSDKVAISIVDGTDTAVDSITARTEGSFFLKISVGGFIEKYKIEFDSDMKDLNSIIADARANGTPIFGGLDANNTFVYVSDVEEGQTVRVTVIDTVYYATVETTARPSVVSDMAVIKTVYDEDIESSNVASPEYNIIFPTGETSSIEITVPGNYYGVNRGINPVNKTVANATDEWTLNSEWGIIGESGVGKITVAKGVEGVINIDGITMRDRFVDTNRVVANGKLTVNVKNVVADHTEQLSIGQGLFDLANARSQNTNSKFGANYDDDFYLTNLFVKQIKNATRILSDSVPATVVVDNIYVDYTAAGTGNSTFQPTLSNFKNGSGNINGNYTVKNSMFRNHAVLSAAQSSLGLIGFQPQKDDANYNLTVTDNVFYDATATGAVISFDTNRVNSANISNNLFIDNNKDGKGIISSNYVDADNDGVDDKAATKLENFIIDSNSFLGYYSDAASFDVRLGRGEVYTNVFLSLEVNFTGLTGSKHIYGTDDYWLDFAREWKFSEFSISGITGLGDGAGVSIDQGSGKISFILDEGVFYDSMFDKPAGTLLAMKDAGGNRVTSIEVAPTDPDAEFVYTVELSKSGVSRIYELTVYTYSITDFTTAMAGKEIADFWLIDASARGVAAGQGIAAGWAGNRYRFYAGANIFSSVDEAVTYASEIGVTPKLLVSEWSGDLEINVPMSIYAPNYNVEPHIKGTAADGSDWTENSAYTANQVCVDDIVIGASAVGEIVIAGFTMNGTYIDKAKANNNNVTKVTLKNILVDSSSSTYFFDLRGNAKNSAGNADELTVQNMYFKKVKNKSSLFYSASYLPNKTTFDNIYLDGKTAGFVGGTTNINVYTKGVSPCFTIKNSNIRQLYATYNTAAKYIMYFRGTSSDTEIKKGKTCELVFDNNVLYNFATYQSRGAYSILYWDGDNFSDVTFTNNNIIYNRSDLTNAKVTAAFIQTAGITSSNRNNPFGNATVTGNRIIGIASGMAIYTGSYYAAYTMDVHDNFTLTSYDADYEVVTDRGVEFVVNTRHTKRTDDESYFIDYAMTLGTGRILDYVLSPVDSYTTVYQDEDKVYYYLDPARDSTAKVQITENVDGSADYSVDMRALFSTFSTYNTYVIKYASAKVNVNEDILTFTLSAEDYALNKDQLFIDIVITAMDGNFTKTVKLELSKYPDAFIPAVTVIHPSSTSTTGTVSYDVAEQNDIAVTENANGTYTVDLSKLVNTSMLSKVTYGDNTAVTVPFNADSYPIIIDVTIDGNPYNMYIADEINSASVNSLTINGITVEPNRYDVFVFNLEGGHGRDAVEFNLPKYVTAVIKENGVPVEGINVANDSVGDYEVVATDIFGGTKTYSLRVTVEKSIGELQQLIATANKMTVNSDIYSEVTVEKFNTAFAEAKVVNMVNNTQSEINDALDKLNDAINGLVDISALKTVIENGKAIDTADYCYVTANALNTAIAGAQDTVVNALSSDEVNTAISEINTAINGLTKHTFTDYVYNNDAMCGKDGTETAHCVNGCEGISDTRTKAGTKLGHSFTKVTYNNDATCTADGTETVTCANGCGTTYTRVAENTKIAHKFTNYVLDADGTTKTATCDHGCGTKDTVKVEINPGTDNKFTDVVQGSWYDECVNFVYSKGIMTGTSETTFAPNVAMTRAMTVTIIARMIGVDTDALKDTATKFTDVETGKWYTGAVAWAVSVGITTGTSDTTFSPTANVTREDLCVLLVRAASISGINLKSDVAKTVFPDDAKIGTWAKESVYICQQAGIINGTSDGTFDPKGVATRAAVAKIITVFYRDYLEK